ncbi:ACP S-malonyltransferase [Paenibacillus pabuli]|uniref:ACP S-malonyltransferase n=1 Tax=Paenibacillus pabuli TaxID=1472 RepID=UPI000784D598|nr:ACP S-malonyltransferase [Paenibacillus pabuli]MEC0126209.1 ACP S-malonyltransferase [Paenibacillus pabuli]
MSVALIFPGQGSQYIGMGKELCTSFSLANQTIEEASEIINMDITKCWRADYNLNNTREAQPMILAVTIAAFRVYQNVIGSRPSVAAGHSLGEYAALVSSGHFSFKDALNIVKARGELMQAASDQFPGQMIAIMHSNYSDVEEIYDRTRRRWRDLTLACDNSKLHKVFSGTTEATGMFITQLEEKNIHYKVISNSGAFHNDTMQSAANKMFDVLSNVEVNKGDFPVLSNVDALPHTLNTLKKMLVLQVTKPVRWRETVDNLVRYGAKIFVEIGPRKVLGNMIDPNKNSFKFLSFSTSKDVDHVRSILEIYTNDSEENKYDFSFIDEFLNHSIVMKNHNHTNSNNSQIYEIYRKIEDLKNNKNNNENVDGQIIQYVLEICSLKNVPLEEQESLIKNLLRKTRLK